MLQAKGFALATKGDAVDTVTTLPLDGRLPTKFADCGRMWGIPYQFDQRTKTRISITVTAKEGVATVRSGITGGMARGFGQGEIPLACVSKGAYEAELLHDIQGKLGTP